MYFNFYYRPSECSFGKGFKALGYFEYVTVDPDLHGQISEYIHPIPKGMMKAKKVKMLSHGDVLYSKEVARVKKESAMFYIVLKENIPYILRLTISCMIKQLLFHLLLKQI